MFDTVVCKVKLAIGGVSVIMFSGQMSIAAAKSDSQSNISRYTLCALRKKATSKSKSAKKKGLLVVKDDKRGKEGKDERNDRNIDGQKGLREN